jgi:hypothetical protein
LPFLPNICSITRFEQQIIAISSQKQQNKANFLARPDIMKLDRFDIRILDALQKGDQP